MASWLGKIIADYGIVEKSVSFNFICWELKGTRKIFRMDLIQWPLERRLGSILYVLAR
jgi:hypothetical protein